MQRWQTKWKRANLTLFIYNSTEIIHVFGSGFTYIAHLCPVVVCQWVSHLSVDHCIKKHMFKLNFLITQKNFCRYYLWNFISAANWSSSIVRDSNRSSTFFCLEILSMYFKNHFLVILLLVYPKSWRQLPFRFTFAKIIFIN